MSNQPRSVANAIGRLAFALTLLGCIAVSCRDFGDHSGLEPSPSAGGDAGAGNGSGSVVNGKSGDGGSGSEGGEAGSPTGGTSGSAGATNVGGEGGGGGSAGKGANESGSGGEGGGHGRGTSVGGESGSGGEPNDDEVILSPTCLSSPQEAPPYPFDEASDVAACDLQVWRPAAVFTTQPSLNIALVSSPDDVSGDTWLPWGCFDPLLNPQRVAATNLSNNSIEVYAIAEGQLQARRLHPNLGWSPWTSLSMPPSSGASDIAMLGNPQVDKTEIFLAGTSRLYRRQRVSSDPYANLGPWKVFSEVELRAVAAGETPLGVRWVVGVGASGKLLATNTASNEGAHLGAFGTVEGGAVDVAAGYESNLALFFLAADAEGGLWRLKVSTGTNEWSLLKAPSQAPKIRAISVGSSMGDTPLFFAVDDEGRVHRSENGAAWTRMD